MFTTITGEKVGQPPLPVVYNIDELCNELLQDGNRLIPDFEQRLNGDYIPVRDRGKNLAFNWWDY